MSISNSARENVHRFDSRLRLREVQGPDPMKPGQSCVMVVLERLNRNRCYERIGWVRPDLLGDGTMLLNKLHRNDVRQYGSGEKAAQAYDAADRLADEKRKLDRKENFIEVGKAAFPHVQRRLGSRISNAGMPGART